MDERISCQGLYVSLGRGKHAHPVLSGVDMRARAGQVLGICGANGVGKSTLLRALAGFVQARAGQVLLSGKPLAGISLAERAWRFAFMHQDTVLNFDFTVREIVEMGRYPYRKTMAAQDVGDQEAVTSAMQRAGCAQLAEQHFSRLSGGERQRVLLARLLAQRAELWFLDEPTASLDVSVAQRLYEIAREHAAQGGAVVIAMHDLRAAAAVCTDLLLLHGGRVLAGGKPGEVLTAENLRTAYGVSVMPFQNPAGQWDYYLEGSS